MPRRAASATSSRAKPEELTGQVADPARQADPRMQHKAAVVGVVKGAQLAQQLTLFQVVVQKPERNRPKLPRRRLEHGKHPLQIHFCCLPRRRSIGCVGQGAQSAVAWRG